MSVDADPWGSGNPYEQFMGRWSRVVAHEFLKWLSISGQKRWLDVGCGTGALSEAIIDSFAPQDVLAVDASDMFVAFAEQTHKDPRLRFRVADARKLPVKTGSIDVAVSGLAMNFVPEPDLALREMVRSTRTNGAVALYVWDYAGKMEMLRFFWDAVIALDPAAEKLDEGVRFPLCQPSALEMLFKQGGLRDVEVRPIDVPAVFRDFDDFWTPFLGGQGPAPGYVLSLSDRHRHALATQLRAELPVGADGSISLIARAWAVRGVVV